MSFALAGVSCVDVNSGDPKPIILSDASTTPPSMDASMDAALPPEEEDDAAVWDPSSGLPRECVEKPKPLIDPQFLPRCPNCEGDARCVPSILLEQQAPEMLSKLMACDETSVCVPDPIISTMGFYGPESCRSVGDSEGRCLSECLPQVASQRDILPQSNCPEHERCVPCFDPRKGTETGACGLTCDLGPQEAPKPWAACCGGLGACLPAALVPADQAGQLSADSCADQSALCAPTLLMDDTARPAQCSSVGGAEGRCMPSCLPAIAARASSLPQDACRSGEVCAPCFDPFTGADSGACRLHGDAPTQPASTFAHCCGDLGTCVPRTLVGEADAARLPATGCEQNGSLCVPNAFLDPSFVPASCRSIGGGEGRCVASCMLPADQLGAPIPRSNCAQGELCAPCFNPLDGTATGVCSVRGDTPKEPVLRFDTECCGKSGLCIPGELSGSDAKSLPVDRCGGEHGSGWVCAPKSVVNDPSRASNPFASCKVDLGLFRVGRGKCVPNCMVEASRFVKRLLQRSNCESGESCVPCSVGGVPGC
jgi:hypothetical protein